MSRDKHLGKIVDLVESDPAFAADRAAFNLLQELVAGLKRMRARTRLSQAEVAVALGVTQGRVSQIESGLPDNAPSLEMIARYAVVCNESATVVFSGEGSVANPDLPTLEATRIRKPARYLAAG